MSLFMFLMKLAWEIPLEHKVLCVNPVCDHINYALFVAEKHSVTLWNDNFISSNFLERAEYSPIQRLLSKSGFD